MSQCVDINECLNSTACGDNFLCTNTEGNFNCECAPDYYLNGSECGELMYLCSLSMYCLD